MELITKYSGGFSKPATIKDGDVENTTIILKDDSGKEKVLFVGNKFNKKEWEKKQKNQSK